MLCDALLQHSHGASRYICGSMHDMAWQITGVRRLLDGMPGSRARHQLLPPLHP